METISLLKLVIPTAEESMMTFSETVVWLTVLISKTASIAFFLWFLVKVVGLKISIGG